MDCLKCGRGHCICDSARTPSPASTAGGARQSIRNDLDFRGLLRRLIESDGNLDEKREALIAHIDTWAGRSADTARLDWLEAMANEREGILLHDGEPGKETGRRGLGLNRLGRSLRQAIDQARGAAPAPGNSGKPTQTQEGETE